MVKTPVAEDTEHFGHMTNQAEAELEASFLLNSFYIARRC